MAVTSIIAACAIWRIVMDESEARHVPVLQREVVEFLSPRPGDLLVDATVGEGGHALALLEKMGGEGCLIGLDRDSGALRRAAERLAPFGDRALLRRANFSQLALILEGLRLDAVDGFLFDLGISSLQLEEPERGFSYQQAARLDMRMDTGQELDAWKVVNRYEERELARIIREYGEERWASRIARRIAIERKRAPIDTTDRLVEIVKDAIPAGARRAGGHPARRTFQALRIEVNRELQNLEQVLPQAVGFLKKGGRIAVISYHSLEDRIVKRFFTANGSPCRCPRQRGGCACEAEPRLRILTRKPVLPGEGEIRENPRARSAKLRVAEKR